MSESERRLTRAWLAETIDPLHAGVSIDYEVVRAEGGDRVTLSVRRDPCLFDTRETARASEEHEHEEIARLLGCSVGTSKSQLHKARMKLRGLLKKQKPPRAVRRPLI